MGGFTTSTVINCRRYLQIFYFKGTNDPQPPSREGRGQSGKRNHRYFFLGLIQYRTLLLSETYFSPL